MNQKQICEGIKAEKYQFAVPTLYSQERTGDEELRDFIAAKWEQSDEREAGNGNCHHDFYFNIAKQSFEFNENSLHFNEGYLSMYKILSPALLLYRLIATFFFAPECENGYKMIWHFNLQHKETGKKVTFSEWKGAPGFWLPDTDFKKLPATFRNDLIELCNYLISNKCAHPYDNLVAGSIA